MNFNDQILYKVLEFILEKVGENYAILTAEEVLNSTNLNLPSEELLNTFNALNFKGAIRLKYNDGKTFCCAITPRGKELVERFSLQATKDCKTSDKTPYFLIFISAFLGGVLGGIITQIAGFIL